MIWDLESCRSEFLSIYIQINRLTHHTFSYLVACDLLGDLT